MTYYIGKFLYKNIFESSLRLDVELHNENLPYITIAKANDDLALIDEVEIDSFANVTQTYSYPVTKLTVTDGSQINAVIINDKIPNFYSTRIHHELFFLTDSNFSENSKYFNNAISINEKTDEKHYAQELFNMMLKILYPETSDSIYMWTWNLLHVSRMTNYLRLNRIRFRLTFDKMEDIIINSNMYNYAAYISTELTCTRIYSKSTILTEIMIRN